MYGYLGVVGAAIMVAGVVTIVVSIGMMIARAGLSVGQALVVLGLGNAALGWLLGRFGVPALRRVTTRLDHEDQREGRWPRFSHWMDRAYVQVLTVRSIVLTAGGLLLAAVGLLVAVAHLIT